MIAKLITLIEEYLDKISTYQNAAGDKIAWTRFTYKGITIKIGLGVNEHGRPFICIKERDNGI